MVMRITSSWKTMIKCFYQLWNCSAFKILVEFQSGKVLMFSSFPSFSSSKLYTGKTYCCSCTRKNLVSFNVERVFLVCSQGWQLLNVLLKAGLGCSCVSQYWVHWWSLHSLAAGLAVPRIWLAWFLSIGCLACGSAAARCGTSTW